jgi:hypothetical protein
MSIDSCASAVGLQVVEAAVAGDLAQPGRRLISRSSASIAQALMKTRRTSSASSVDPASGGRSRAAALVAIDDLEGAGAAAGHGDQAPSPAA